MQLRTITGFGALCFLLLPEYASFQTIEIKGMNNHRLSNPADESARKYQLKNAPTIPPLADLLARLRSRIIANGNLLPGRRYPINTWNQRDVDVPSLWNEQVPSDLEIPETNVPDVVLGAQQTGEQGTEEAQDEGPISEISSQTEDFGGVEYPAQPQLSPEDFTKCVQNCRTTHEINPVCGDDGFTYGNIDKLICAQHCGKAVHSFFMGHCEDRK